MLYFICPAAGMHLGEKGFWNKWSLADEAARVPLIVVDPLTPPLSRGLHYSFPVELLDIFPTLLDMFPTLLRCPPPSSSHYISPVKCPPLQGKSLARVLFDFPVAVPFKAKNTWFPFTEKLYKYLSVVPFLSTFFAAKPKLPSLNMTFAVTQVLKCAKNTDIQKYNALMSQLESLQVYGSKKIHSALALNITNPWENCITSAKMLTKNNIAIEDETSLMGYSFRLRDFQYIMWLRYDRKACRLQDANEPPYAEEYFKRRTPYRSVFDGSGNNYGYISNVNVFNKVDVNWTTRFRKKAISFLTKKRFFKFKNCY